MRTVTHLAGVVALAATVSGCGLLAGPSEREVIASMVEQSATVGQSLSAAVNYAVTSRSTMSAEFRVLEANLDAELEDFNALTDDLNSTDEITEAAQGFAQAINLAAGLLSDGSVDVAAEVTRTQVDPKLTTLQGLLSTRQAEIGGASDGGSQVWLWIVALPVLAFGVYVVVQRRRPSLEDLLAQPNAAPPPEIRNDVRPANEPPKRPRVSERNETNDDSSLVEGLELPPPIGEISFSRHDSEPVVPPANTTAAGSGQGHEPQRKAAGPIRNPEAVHSVRGGLRTVELRGIIDAALATVADAGWEVAIECPDVSVLVDPLRMRRLLSNLLLSATAHGAEHIGLVGVIVDDKVEVNVGHDGSLLEDVADSNEMPPEVEHQLTVARQLLAGMHADARWSNWRGVSLYTIELVRGPDEVAGHDLPANATAD